MAVKTNSRINNKNYFRIRTKIGYDSEGKAVMKNFYGKNKTEAEFKRDEFLKALKNGVRIDTSPILLETAMKDWLLTVIKTSSIKDSSFQKYYEEFNKYIKGSSLGLLPIQSISAQHIQKYLNDFTETKTSNLINRLYRYLKRFFDYSIGINMIQRSPIIGVVIPSGLEVIYESEETYSEPFTIEEKNKIIAHSREQNPMYGDVIFLLFKLGGRRGEMLGLTPEKVNFKENLINIDKSLSKVKLFDNSGNGIGYTFQLGPPKNKVSMRVNYFDEETKSVFKNAIKRQKEIKIKLGIEYSNNMNLIFTSDTGKPIDPKNFWEFWGRILSEQKIPYRKPHSTRSTFVTEMYEKGVDELTTQRIIGHSKDSKITRVVYTKDRNRTFKDRMLAALK